MKNCSNCDHWIRDASGPCGSCKCMPPTPVGVEAFPIWPKTLETMVCGQHKENWHE